MASRSSNPHPNVEDRRDVGEQAREKTPLPDQADWHVVDDRPDPVELLLDQDKAREPDLVPVRHGRMLVSPFTFYRGSATIMATDLAGTPTAGLDVQLCGDAHLSNFGAFASPERHLVFSLNDFDETLPGPFEYDVKRMVASFVIAAQNNKFSPGEARSAAIEAGRTYRSAMAEFAAMPTLNIWYAHMTEADVEDSMKRLEEQSKAREKKAKRKGATDTVDRDKAEAAAIARAVKTATKTIRKAHTRDSVQALSQLSEVVDGRHRIVSNPPTLVPLRDISSTYDIDAEQAEELVRGQFTAYRKTLPDDRRILLDRFEIVDMARKVVGVGSVGTRAFILLMQGRDAQDPFFLQVKEATASVYESHLAKSEYKTSGERVVRGQRMMQATSDIFLGWTKGIRENRYYYWRQLRDMKGSAVIEKMSPIGLYFYARMCGWSLARAHARSGDPIAISAYLGADDGFENAVADFAHSYAAQNERDYKEFAAAVNSGRVSVISGV